MSRSYKYILVSFFFLVLFCGALTGYAGGSTKFSLLIQEDPGEKRLLLNGRIWGNQYSRVHGDQYFLLNSFLKGSVCFNGRHFDDLDLKYDILNDELLLSLEGKPIIILNKEMVDSFTIRFLERTYTFFNSGHDTSGIFEGYVNILYDGSTSLYVKYSKKILPLAVEGRYDLFSQENRIYLKMGQNIVAVSGRRHFLKLLNNKKKEIREHFKGNLLKISQKDPDTFIPVIQYYDSLVN